MAKKARQENIGRARSVPGVPKGAYPVEACASEVSYDGNGDIRIRTRYRVVRGPERGQLIDLWQVCHRKDWKEV